MLTPGEIVSTKAAADQFGDEITRMNQQASGGQTGSGSQVTVKIYAIDGDSVLNTIRNNRQEFGQGMMELVESGHLGIVK